MAEDGPLPSWAEAARRAKERVSWLQVKRVRELRPTGPPGCNELRQESALEIRASTVKGVSQVAAVKVVSGRRPSAEASRGSGGKQSLVRGRRLAVQMIVGVIHA